MAVFILEREKFSQMVDIETTGLISSSGIIQIGACRYDISKKTTFDHFTVNIDLGDLYKHDFLDHDPETLKWWAGQDESVKKAVLTGGGTLKDALLLFEDWVDNRYSITAFGYLDLPALQYSYKKVLGKKEPWNHKKVLDLRTILLLSGGYDADAKSLSRDDKHIALSDAIAQCEVIFDLLGSE